MFDMWCGFYLFTKLALVIIFLYNTNMNWITKSVTNIILAFLLSFSVSPGRGYTQSSDEKPIIRFADIGWDSVRFHNAVAGLVAERFFNFEVRELSSTSVIAHEALTRGELDVVMEEWTANLPTYQEDVKAGKLQELGINFDDNSQGFYVPRYVIEGDAQRGLKPLAPGLKSVKDLAKYPQLFPDMERAGCSVIYGGIPGWAITEIMRSKVQYYGLDKWFNYVEPGTDAALSTVIASAMDRGVPVVAYYWTPTWLMGKYDLVLLEDAPFDAALWEKGACACPSVKVTVCVSNAFAQKYPEFCAFLSRYRTTSALISEALAYMQETGADSRTAAEWFLERHGDFLQKCLPDYEGKNMNGKEKQEGLRPWLDFPQIFEFNVNKVDKSLRKFADRYYVYLSVVSRMLVSSVVAIESLLNHIPWFVILAGIMCFGKFVRKSWKWGVPFCLLLCGVGLFGLWPLMNTTLAIVIVSVFWSLLFGLPLGICLANSQGMSRAVRPVLDAMQTMPVFVYLIPAMLFFGMGYAPAVIATVIYAIVPVIRMTALGISQVDKEMVEASKAFGSTWWQTLCKVEIPQAAPTIMAGVNQTIMMAMSMVVTCSMIGARGLGHEVLVAVQRMEIGRGMTAGGGVVILAVILDRMTQQYKKKDKHQ